MDKGCLITHLVRILFRHFPSFSDWIPFLGASGSLPRYRASAGEVPTPPVKVSLDFGLGPKCLDDLDVRGVVDVQI